MTVSRVSKSDELKFKERREAAKEVLDTHFPNASKKSKEDNAYLLGSGLTTFGGFVPTLKHSHKKQLDDIVQNLKLLISDAPPHWIKKELLKAKNILETAPTAHILHGRQNTNEMPDKVQLVSVCRQIWFGQYKKEAPIAFQNETHPFSRFVAAVISEVHLKEWSPQSAIEAYKKYK
jgi:hypothetical protein